jgi:hypothetical protein
MTHLFRCNLKADQRIALRGAWLLLSNSCGALTGITRQSDDARLDEIGINSAHGVEPYGAFPFACFVDHYLGNQCVASVMKA